MSQVVSKGCFPERLDPRASAAHDTFAGVLSRNSRAYAALRWMYQPIKAVRFAATQMIWNLRTRRIVHRYLSNPGFKGLHVGCGRFRLGGWLNTDQLGFHAHADFPLDITRRFPFPDGTIDAIYACEVIEHVSRREGEAFLREALRVLKRGGVLRITTPGLGACCRLYLGLNPDASIEQFESVFLEGGFSPEVWLNTQFSGHGHKHLWSHDSLTRAMIQAGFARVSQCRPQETGSNLPQLSCLETRYGDNPPPWLFARTLIIEGAAHKRA